MPRFARFPSHGQLRQTMDTVRRGIRPHEQLILFILLGVSSGVLLSVLALQVQPGDRLVIGNTAGSLTTIIETDQQRILVGAGASRSHAAELLGRTTRPWDREIDLLVLPGWDDQHVTGALGLIERETVHGVAVLGLPGDEPLWTHLERDIQAQGVEVTYISEASVLEIGSDTVLSLAPVIGPSDGIWARLDRRGKRVDIVDTADATYARPDPSALDSEAGHIIINIRNYVAPAASSPELLIMQTPHWHSDFEDATYSHSAMIDRDDHLVVNLENEQFRVPFDSVHVAR